MSHVIIDEDVKGHVQVDKIPMSDAELEALKARYRTAIAAAEAAEAAAIASKAAYDEKAEALDDIAQQSTLTQGVTNIRSDIANIDIDTSELARQGSNAAATNTAILEAVSNNAALNIEVESAKVALVEAINGQGGDSTTQESLTELAQDVADLTVQQLDLTGLKYTEGWTPRTVAEAVAYKNEYLEEVDDDNVIEIVSDNAFANCTGLKKVRLANCERITGGTTFYMNLVNGAGQVNRELEIELPICTEIRSVSFGRGNYFKRFYAPELTSLVDWNNGRILSGGQGVFYAPKMATFNPLFDDGTYFEESDSYAPVCAKIMTFRAPSLGLNSLELLRYANVVEEVYAPNLTYITGNTSGGFHRQTHIKIFEAPLLQQFSTATNWFGIFGGTDASTINDELEELSFPLLTDIGYYFVRRYTALKRLKTGVINSWVYNSNTNVSYGEVFRECANFLDLEIAGTTPSMLAFHFEFWKPTDVLSDIAKVATLNSNLRNHFIANLYDRSATTRGTVSVCQSFYNALEASTISALTDKGWDWVVVTDKY